MGPKKKATPAEARKLDTLAAALRDVDPERLRTLLRKDGKIDLRISEREKAEIQQAADRRGLTVSAYLLGLHEQAMKRERS